MRPWSWNQLAVLVVGIVVVPHAVVSAEAQVGQPAPDFTVTDAQGVSHHLAADRGKFVVLEWSNHECPFVRKQYDSGTMQRLQQQYTANDVVWLTMLSSAPGNQGHVSAEQAQALTRQRHAHPTAVLLDAEGTVGRLYGAKTTPQMFLINPEGLLIYAGAIDDRRSTDPADVEGVTNYVKQALDEALAGQPVSIAQTRSYGCSVKYQW